MQSWHTTYPASGSEAGTKGEVAVACASFNIEGQSGRSCNGGSPALQRDPQAEPAAWAHRQRELYRHDWVVYAKTPLGGPAQVLEYLSRYTHRTAIGN